MFGSEEISSLKLTSLPAIAAENDLTVVVSAELANNLTSMTISELSHLMRKGEANVIFAIPNSVTKSECELFASTYALPITEKDVVWTRNQEETEVLLKVGSVQAGIVNKLEETLSLTEFELLKDDKNVFVMSQSALTLNRDLLIRYPEIGVIETKLRTLLTTEKMQALVRRVRLLDYSPTEVAMELLLREGLIIR